MKQALAAFCLTAVLVLSGCSSNVASSEAPANATASESVSETTSEAPANTSASESVISNITEQVEYIPYSEAEIPVSQENAPEFAQKNKNSAAALFSQLEWNDYK